MTTAVSEEEDATIRQLAELLCAEAKQAPLWSFQAFRLYADVFHTIAEWRAEHSRLPLLLMKAVDRVLFKRSAKGGGEAADDASLSPLVRADADADYTAVVVWENAPLPTRDRALLRIYLEMALDLQKPVGIIGNVTGIRQRDAIGSAVMDDADEVTTDLFLLVHRDDIPKFMRARSIQMGIRFYDELICEGKYFTESPTESSSCPQTVWDGAKN